MEHTYQNCERVKIVARHEEAGHLLKMGSIGAFIHYRHNEPDFCEVEGVSSTHGKWVSQTCHITDIEPAPLLTSRGRVPSNSEGHEGGHVYAFPTTDQSF